MGRIQGSTTTRLRDDPVTFLKLQPMRFRHLLPAVLPEVRCQREGVVRQDQTSGADLLLSWFQERHDLCTGELVFEEAQEPFNSVQSDRITGQSTRPNRSWVFSPRTSATSLEAEILRQPFQPHSSHSCRIALWKEWRTVEGVGSLVQCLACRKNHLTLLPGAWELSSDELTYLNENGWLVHHRNPACDL